MPKAEHTQIWQWPEKNRTLEAARAERVKEYGSFLYCPAGDSLCCHIDNEAGVCDRVDCVHNDQTYIERQQRQKERYGSLQAVHIAEAAAEKEAQKNIRTQRAAPYKRRLTEEVERKKEEARRFYWRGHTNQGDSVEKEIIKLYAKLEKVEAKNDQ